MNKKDNDLVIGTIGKGMSFSNKLSLLKEKTNYEDIEIIVDEPCMLDIQNANSYLDIVDIER